MLTDKELIIEKLKLIAKEIELTANMIDSFVDDKADLAYSRISYAMKNIDETLDAVKEIK